MFVQARNSRSHRFGNGISRGPLDFNCAINGILIACVAATARTVCSSDYCPTGAGAFIRTVGGYFVFFYFATSVSSLTDAVFVVFDEFVSCCVAALSGRSVSIGFFLRFADFIGLPVNGLSVDRKGKDGKED